MPNVLFSYSRADERYRDQIEKQLSMLKRQGVIEAWHDRRIGAGQEIERSIDEHINSDEIILLLVSADFLASNYCYDIEMQRAMERYERGEAIVIPVILRACDWHHALFGKLKAVPLDGKPITQWADIDDALLQVAKAVREAAERLGGATTPQRPPRAIPGAQAAAAAQRAGPRSSNLRLAKTFSEREMDQFRVETFEYIARFFENSLGELTERSQDIEGVFRRVDSTRFFATIYRSGKALARSTVFTAGEAWARGINYVNGETTASNSMNETLRVEADDETLYLTSSGMSMMGGGREQKLSQEGAAELLWGILIGPLQNRGGW